MSKILIIIMAFMAIWIYRLELIVESNNKYLSERVDCNHEFMKWYVDITEKCLHEQIELRK